MPDDSYKTPAASANFDGQCGNCGCEFRQVRCTQPECEGCTVTVENETCRHVFTHRLGALSGETKAHQGFRPISRMDFRSLRRGNDLEGGSEGGSRLHRESVFHTVTVSDPDSHLSILGPVDEGNDVSSAGQTHNSLPFPPSIPLKIVDGAARASRTLAGASHDG